MKHILYKSLFALLLTMFVSVSSFAQFDVFGGMAPADQKTTATKTGEKKFTLPDKPNKLDAQGRKQGEWAKKYENGQYQYLATFRNDIPVGTLTRYYENGKKSAELTYNADGTISCTLYHENGKLATKGTYSSTHIRISNWTFYNEEGYKVLSENYKNGKLHGTRFTYFDNGKVSDESNYVEDVLHGPWFEYTSSGHRRLEAHYVHGKLDGSYKFWTIDGILSIEGKYRLGTQIGDWKVYNENGNGEFFVMQYDDNGQLLNEQEVQDRMNSEMEKREKTRKFIVDPQDFINDPESYRP